MKTPKLTIRHELLLDMMKNTVTLLTGKPPTRAALVKALGPEWAAEREKAQLQELTRKGVLKLVGRTARNIRTPEAKEPPTQPSMSVCALHSPPAAVRGQKKPPKTIIHVNQHIIKANTKNAENNPPLTIKTYKQGNNGHEVDILDKQGNPVARVVHRPHDPLSCGARVWIEADFGVDITR